MEKPFLVLGAKQFLTGINPAGSHAVSGGIFFEADGVTPLFEAGSAQSELNGVLMAGAAATTVATGVTAPNGNIMASTPDIGVKHTSGAFFSDDTNHIYSYLLDSTFSGTISDDHTAAVILTPGLTCFKTSGGVDYLFYRQVSQIGSYDGTTWTDGWKASADGIAADYWGAMHRYFDQIVFGNGFGQVGLIDAVLTVTAAALDIPNDMVVTDISDDGQYVCLAVTNNSSADPIRLGDTRILWWDGVSSSWLREYPITDPFIYAIKKTPVGVFAFGVTGIWQITFSGVKKVFNHAPGIYTKSGASSIHYGRGAVSFFSDALMWGGKSGSNYVIKSIGKLDSAAPNAYLHPFKTTASKEITSIDAQIQKGYVFVGEQTPQLLAYPFSTTNSAQTGVSGRSIYVKLPSPVEITHVDVILPVALASGDSLSMKLYKDASTSVDFGTISYDSAKTDQRRLQFRSTDEGAPVFETHMAIEITFTGGEVKIADIEFFGAAADREIP